MRKLLGWSTLGTELALFSPAVLSARLEEVQEFVGMVGMQSIIFIMVAAAIWVYFMRPPMDKRDTPLRTVMAGRTAIYSAPADALVTQCTQQMTEKKIGSLMIMENDKVIGIFTERDALNRVLAGGRDPNWTKVCEVMTGNPYCVSPDATVGEAMAVVTKRRFRHLPLVENGKLSGVMSTRDLVSWLAKNKVVGVEELLELALHAHNPA